MKDDTYIYIYISLRIFVITSYKYYIKLSILLTKMFHKDISYLYSDDYLTSSSSNNKDLISNSMECRPIKTRICRKRASTLMNSRRSKHIILSREDALKYEIYQIAAKRLREKQQLLEENLQNKIKQLEAEQFFLENNLIERESYIQDLKNEINKNLLINSNGKETTMSLSSDDLDIFNMSIERISGLDTNMDDRQ